MISRLQKIFSALAIALCATSSAMADGIDNEQFLDGYDHSLQNYITQRLSNSQSQASSQGQDSKKWKLDDYVTIPKFGGYIVGSFKYNSADDKNSFDLRMLRLYIDGTVFRDFNYRVQMEVSGNPGGNGMGARVVDAYIDWTHWKEFGVKLGEFKRCFTFENPMNPWDICGGDYSQLTKYMTCMGNSHLYRNADGTYNHNNGGRDLGIQFHGDLFPAANDGHPQLKYQFGIYNGQGINVSDQDQEKDYIGTLQYQPIKGLLIGVFGWSGSYYDGKQSNYFKRWATGISYEGLFSARAEYARNIFYQGGKSDGWNVILGYNVWRWLKPYVRYDAYRSDMTMNSLSSIYSVGLQARPHRNLQFQLQYNHQYQKLTHSATNQLWAMAYIRF